MWHGTGSGSADSALLQETYTQLLAVSNHIEERIAEGYNFICHKDATGTDSSRYAQTAVVHEASAMATAI